jgi:hypothetical protein
MYDITLPILGKLLKETNHEAAREARILADLIKAASELPSDIPTGVLALAADAIGWQRVKVCRAMEGKETP